jgi:hypothetical protein
VSRADSSCIIPPDSSMRQNSGPAVLFAEWVCYVRVNWRTLTVSGLKVPGIGKIPEERFSPGCARRSGCLQMPELTLHLRSSSRSKCSARETDRFSSHLAISTRVPGENGSSAQTPSNS